MSLAQPDAGAEQAGGEDAGERGARALADPPARDRDREQEREPGEHGDAAEPGEHAAADEVLEVAVRAGRDVAAARGGAAGAAAARGAERAGAGGLRDADGTPRRAAAVALRGAPRASRAPA